MKYTYAVAGLAAAVLMSGVELAFAHVVVRPDTVGIAAYQTFTISVPNEQSEPTIALRLVIPEGLKSVSPTVKPGWKIEVKKEGDRAIEINWTGGSIPVGQRDDFTFSTQAPASATVLKWQAYQTYKGGTVVAWDMDPAKEQPKDAGGKNDFSRVGPYSQTKVVDDLTGTDTKENAPSSGNGDKGLVMASLALSVVALGVAVRKRQ